jgi:hypothetical protein
MVKPAILLGNREIQDYQQSHQGTWNKSLDRQLAVNGLQVKLWLDMKSRICPALAAAV